MSKTSNQFSDKISNQDSQDNDSGSKKEAQNKSESALPGYLNYPSNEDIMNSKNKNLRVDANVENLTRENLSKQPPLMKDNSIDITKTEDEEPIEIVPGTEADVTQDDLLALKAIDHEMEGDKNELNSDGSASAFSGTEETATELDEKDLTGDLERTGDDLDIPGADLDDANEEIGEEDEENNYYSLGGDEKENLEDDATAEGY